MFRTHLIFSTLFLSLVFGSCKEDKKEGESGGADEKKAPAASFVTLDKLGISAELPAGTNVNPGIGGDGVMIQGTDLVMSIDDGSKKPEDADKAKEDADMYTPQDIKVEKLDDGYIMTFTNKGGMGTNYWLMGRRVIEGKAFWCSTTAPNETIVTNAIKVCKSLKK